MATLRLIEPHEPAVPQDPASERPKGELAPRPMTADLPTLGDARIRLASLPTPLRAVVRERSEKGITIAADLPWLAIGTPIEVLSSDGGEQTGSVQSFDVEVTSGGSARLLIFATPSDSPTSGARTPPGEQTRRRRRWPLMVAMVLVAAAAAIGGYLAGQRSVVQPAPLLGVTIPVRPAPAAPVVAAPAQVMIPEPASPDLEPPSPAVEPAPALPQARPAMPAKAASKRARLKATPRRK
jgi:hypothetical protein